MSDALLDAYLSDVARQAASGKRLKLVPGVMTAQGIKSWRESAFPGRGLGRRRRNADGPLIENLGTKQHETHQVDWDVKPIARRSNDERLAEATARIYDEAMASYKATGKVSFARSVLEDIQKTFWEAGEPITIEQMERLAEHEIRPMCERYAAKLLTQAQRMNPGNASHYMTPEIRTK